MSNRESFTVSLIAGAGAVEMMTVDARVVPRALQTSGSRSDTSSMKAFARWSTRTSRSASDVAHELLRHSRIVMELGPAFVATTGAPAEVIASAALAGDRGSKVRPRGGRDE
jgi:hypothetical protein